MRFHPEPTTPRHLTGTSARSSYPHSVTASFFLGAFTVVTFACRLHAIFLSACSEACSFSPHHSTQKLKALMINTLTRLGIKSLEEQVPNPIGVTIKRFTSFCCVYIIAARRSELGMNIVKGEKYLCLWVGLEAALIILLRLG